MEPNPDQQVSKMCPSSSDTQKAKVSNQDNENAEAPGPSTKKSKFEAYVHRTVSDPRVIEHGEEKEIAVPVIEGELDAKKHLIVEDDEIIPHKDTKYKVVCKLGAGGFGTVYQIVDMNTLKNIAVKILKSDSFKQELKAMQNLKTLDSPRWINQMNDNFRFKGHDCLLFDLLGESLAEYMYLRRKHTIPLFQIRDIGFQIVSALQFLHSHKVVHADVKLDNIVFAKQEEMPNTNPTNLPYLRNDTNIKLIDYSSSRFTAELCKTPAQTIRYMAPETALFLGFSFPCDVWSLGAVLWELLIGDQLFCLPKNPKDNTPRSEPTKRLELFMVIQLLLGPIPPEKFEPKDGKNFNFIKKWIDDNEATIKIKHPKFKPADEFFVSADPNAQQLLDLVKACLVLEPNQRITMDAALRHRFFADMKVDPANSG